MNPDPFIATAHALTWHGIRIFPTQWQSKAPLLKANWKDLATNNFEQFRQMVQTIPRYGLAIVLGPTSGIMDIELDGEDATKEFEKITALLGGDTPTIAYRSSRGIHRLYRWSPRLGEGKAVVKYRGIELRLGADDKGAYSIAPPSLHASGQTWYQWLPGRSPWEASVAPMPVPMEEFFAQVRAQQIGSSKVEMTRDGDDFVPEPGQRHATALRLTTLLAGHIRLNRDLVTEMMMPFQEYVGKASEMGYEEARKEIHNMVSTVHRTSIGDDILVEVDFQEMYEAARSMAHEVRLQKNPTAQTLPQVFPEWIERMGCTAQRSQIPRTFVLMSALTAVSSALGNTVTAQPSLDTSPTGLQIYSLGVGESGSGKSRAMKTILSSLEGSPSFITNTTPEALMSTIGRTPRGATLKIVEGKQLTRMMGRYSGDAGTDNTVLLESWSGDTISITRQDQRKCIKIAHPFLAIAATVQPHNLRSAFGVDDVMEGLMQRLLVYGGDSVPEEVDREASKEFADLAFRFSQTIIRLSNHRPNYGNMLIMSVSHDDPTEAERATGSLRLVLDEEGYRIWSEYARYKRSMDVQDLYPEEHPFRTDLVRHAEYVLRITGCLFMLDLAGSEERWQAADLERYLMAQVPSIYVQNAIQLMEWLWSEKQRLMTDVVEDAYMKARPEQHLKSMQSLPESLSKFASRRKRILQSRLKGKTIWTARDYQRVLRIPSAELAREEISVLSSTGHVQQIGIRNRTQVYQFSQTERERDPARTARR